MDILNEMKSDRMNAMRSKDKDKKTKDVLTVFIGDCESDAKRGTELTDSYVVKKIKKSIQNSEENFNLTGNDQYLVEVKVLENYLPKQLSEDKLKSIIEGIVSSMDSPNIGSVMKTLKMEYDGQFDGKTASKLAKEMI